MKKLMLKVMLISTFSYSSQIQAGWVAVPSIGFASSAYTNCYNAGRITPWGGIANNNKGNFGSYPIAGANYPAAGSNDTCWIAFSGSESLIPAGKTGFTITAVTVRPIPNPVSGGADIGEIYDRYWRNPTTNACIIATRVRMYSVDSDVSAGMQYFEVNDIVRGGFSNSGTLNIAYAISTSPVTTVSPIFRVGRTFTSVQHRPYGDNSSADKAENGINYLDIPTKNSVSSAITGEAASTTGYPESTTLATQDAVVNANYVDFTIEAISVDDDESQQSSKSFSPITYIEAACTTNPTVQTGAIRLRQTGQRLKTQKVIDMAGYAIGTP